MYVVEELGSNSLFDPKLKKNLLNWYIYVCVSCSILCAY